jgi:hypothetical protein
MEAPPQFYTRPVYRRLPADPAKQRKKKDSDLYIEWMNEPRGGGKAFI